MASIVVRGLDEGVKNQLAEQARAHGRSMEAEVRLILTRATQGSNLASALMDAVAPLGGIDLVIPERSDDARAVAFE